MRKRYTIRKDLQQVDMGGRRYFAGGAYTTSDPREQAVIEGSVYAYAVTVEVLKDKAEGGPETKPGAGAEGDTPEGAGDAPPEKTNAQLKEECTARGLKIPRGATKAQLLELLAGK